MPSAKSVQKKIAKAVDMTMVKVISDFGKEVFDECQRTVPTRSGVLKESGSVKTIGEKGVEIRYSAPHSWDVHNGTYGISDFKWTSDIRQHKRRLPSGGTTTVKRHKKHYTGYKPSVSLAHKEKAVNERWYMRNMKDPYVSKPWIEVAYSTVKSKQPRWLRRLLPRKINIYEE